MDERVRCRRCGGTFSARAMRDGRCRNEPACLGRILHGIPRFMSATSLPHFRWRWGSKPSERQLALYDEVMEPVRAERARQHMRRGLMRFSR